MSGNPVSGNPASGNPASGNPASGNPASGDPASGGPLAGRHETDIGALVRMANQIAKNFGHHPADVAAREVATHLHSFWAPAMRDQICEYVQAGGVLDPVADQAVRSLTVAT